MSDASVYIRRMSGDNSDNSRAGDGWHGDIGGWCPVQGFGEVDGFPWYFRARGEHWSFGVSSSPTGDPVDAGTKNDPNGYCERHEWGTWPGAGYVANEVAWRFIEQSISNWRTAKRTNEQANT